MNDNRAKATRCNDVGFSVRGKRVGNRGSDRADGNTKSHGHGQHGRHAMRSSTALLDVHPRLRMQHALHHARIFTRQPWGKGGIVMATLSHAAPALGAV